MFNASRVSLPREGRYRPDEVSRDFGTRNPDDLIAISPSAGGGFVDGRNGSHVRYRRRNDRAATPSKSRRGFYLGEGTGDKYPV